MDGGRVVAETLAGRGVKVLFTLCGGHISPILVAAKRRGIRVVDTRDEATAVFAADATSRLTGLPGVAAVTAGPGVTNSITALKNAQLAQSSIVLLGGATATLLRGRGALQDIDQMALVRPHVKWAARAARLRDVEPLLSRAFDTARRGVPGPVFLELPVDLLYAEDVVRRFYGVAGNGAAGAMAPRGVAERLHGAVLERHLKRLFAPQGKAVSPPHAAADPGSADEGTVREAAALLRGSRRPVVLAGSQVVLRPQEARALSRALESLGAPVYLSGMARGLLGREHPLQLRHRRRQALAEADLVVLAGVPCDFRLEYGRHIPRGAAVIALNLKASDLRRNRKPRLAAAGDPAWFIEALAESRAASSSPGEAALWAPWVAALRRRDRERDAEIERLAREPAPPVNPLLLCQAIERAIDDDSVVVADGGDFVATASYIVRPRGPLSWLDPGAFGTLGAGAGFALGAKLCRPSSEVWILYGDGSAGYSLMEMDTFARHGIAVIAVVANDASWMQIARDQVAILGDDVGTALRRTDYHIVATGWGGRGLLLDDERRAGEVLAEAKAIARSGTPVVINAHLGRTEFRKGSISL